MSQSLKCAVMRFLAKVSLVAFLENHLLHSYLTIKMVQLTIAYGLSPWSPLSFAYFGSYLVKLGNLTKGRCVVLVFCHSNSLWYNTNISK